jgi:hypothetical protein
MDGNLDGKNCLDAPIGHHFRTFQLDPAAIRGGRVRISAAFLSTVSLVSTARKEWWRRRDSTHCGLCKLLFAAVKAQNMHEQRRFSDFRPFRSACQQNQFPHFMDRKN